MLPTTAAEAHKYFYNTPLVLSETADDRFHSGKETGAQTFEYPAIYVDGKEDAFSGAIKKLVLSIASAGVQYLPYLPDALTYTTIEDKAAVFITGPLTGCNVYIAQTAKG